jgi:hypothetical protein
MTRATAIHTGCAGILSCCLVQVPRLTVVSLKELAIRVTRLQQEGKLVIPRAVAWAATTWEAVARVGKRFSALLRGGPQPLATAADGNSTTKGTTAANIQLTSSMSSSGDAVTSISQSCLVMSDEYSTVMRPFNAMEGAIVEPTNSIYPAAVETRADQLGCMKQQCIKCLGDFEKRLVATGAPTPIVDKVMRDLRSCDAKWFDSTQQLVAPGRIYYITRVTGSDPEVEVSDHSASLDGLDANKAVTPEPGKDATLITVAPGGRSQRQYRSQHVTPAALTNMILSGKMLSDHMLEEYRKCILAVRDEATPRSTG